MNERLVNKGNALIVNAYKILGFVLLSVILIGLVSYLGVQGFFVVNHRWVAPTVISPTDEKILGLNTRLAELAAAREQLMAQRRELKVKYDDTGRQIAAHAQFQQRFVASIKGDRTARFEEMQRLLALRHQHDESDEEINESSKAYSGLVRTRAEELKEAQLLEREGYLTQNNKLAEMANARIALAEHSADLQTRLASLQREIRSLEFATRIAGGEAVATSLELSTPVLMLAHEYSQSQLELAKAQETRAMLADNLVAIDGALATYDTLLGAIRNSPYMKAIEGNVTVAFVPYDNIAGATPGNKLYACALGFFWCRQIGEIKSIYDGEVSIRHPVRQTMLRGQMAEIELKDPHAVRKQVLHLEHPPFFL